MFASVSRVFKIAQGRISKNPKELTVTAGEFVEVSSSGIGMGEGAGCLWSVTIMIVGLSPDICGSCSCVSIFPF